MNDLKLSHAVTPEISISQAERVRRKAADDYARASLRLEGFTPSEFSDQLTRRYIDGEITRSELTSAILAHHGL